MRTRIQGSTKSSGTILNAPKRGPQGEGQDARSNPSLSARYKETGFCRFFMSAGK